jgi:pSer/pThr/pTyr-binding forkhead associated (FHA) protein
MIAQYGGSLLIGEENADFSEYRIDRDVTTIGKAKFVHVHAKGFLISSIQAKIVKENGVFVLVNLGRRGKTTVNGEEVDRCILRNGDIITVGKSTFKFVEGTR